MTNNISSNYVHIEGRKIHYLEAGKGEAILLLHGWPTSSYLWRNIIPILAKENHVVALDLPGFGKSEKVISDSFSFRYYNRFISGLVENLNLDKVSLCLHDLGGPIGLNWTVNNIDKVKNLILLNTLVYPEFSWAVKLFGLATIVPGIKQWISSPAGIKKAMNFGVNINDELSEEIIRHYQEPFEDKNSRRVLLKSIQRLSMKGFKQIARELPSFKGPVQILYGENDRILPRVGDTMRRVKKDLPQAIVNTLPNCGHFIQEEEPDKIGGIISEFMNTSSN